MPELPDGRQAGSDRLRASSSAIYRAVTFVNWTDSGIQFPDGEPRRNGAAQAAAENAPQAHQPVLVPFQLFQPNWRAVSSRRLATSLIEVSAKSSDCTSLSDSRRRQANGRRNPSPQTHASATACWQVRARIPLFWLHIRRKARPHPRQIDTHRAVRPNTCSGWLWEVRHNESESTMA